MNLVTIKKLLKTYYDEHGPERVGFIVPRNEIVEVKNTSEKPYEGFLVDAQEIIHYTEERNAIATWHTHPNQDANLSGEDNKIFWNWPDLIHFIIGNDGVRAYKFDEELQDIIEVE